MLTVLKYPSAGVVDLNDEHDYINDLAIDLVDWDDCAETHVKRYSIPYGIPYSRYSASK